MSFSRIHIYFRQTAQNKVNNNRPQWFDYSQVFSNLLATMNPDLCQLTVCFDGNDKDFSNHFTHKFFENKWGREFKVRFIDTNAYEGESYENDGSSKSTSLIARIIKGNKLPDSSLIYVLENDYLHLPYWGEMALSLFNQVGGNDYVSLYDHLDKYAMTLEGRSDHWGLYKDLTSKIIVSNGRHWRQVPSICSSWIMSKKVFDRDYDLHSIGISDNTGCEQFLKRGSTCYTPIPSLATHCQEPWVAPLIDWEGVINEK